MCTDCESFAEHNAGIITGIGYCPPKCRKPEWIKFSGVKVKVSSINAVKTIVIEDIYMFDAQYSPKKFRIYIHIRAYEMYETYNTKEELEDRVEFIEYITGISDDDLLMKDMEKKPEKRLIKKFRKRLQNVEKSVQELKDITNEMKENAK